VNHECKYPPGADKSLGAADTTVRATPGKKIHIIISSD